MLVVLVVAAATTRNYGYVRNEIAARAGAATGEALPLLGHSRHHHSHDHDEMPAHFDWRNVDGVSYVVADVQQHAPVYCGSCWVHAVIAMLNDRLKIARRGAYPDVMLGRQVLINCAPKALDGGGVAIGGNGCDGGDERDIYAMLLNESHWLPDETCQPYEARNHSCDAIHTCANCMPTGDGGSSCFAVPAFLRYGISGWRQVTSRDAPLSHAKRERAMQAEILAGGPIVCNFAAIPEFDENYTAVAARHGGVFRTSANVSEDDINHDVVIGGWGTSAEGVKYWVGRNSWGTYWGEHGWFKIERGVDALLIEGACSAADPTFNGLDAELRGHESGGPLGLERIEKRARWPHAPTRSEPPAAWREAGEFVQLGAAGGTAGGARDLLSPVLSGALALALAVSAYAAGVAVTTRRLRRAHGADGGEADGLRAAILRDARGI